MKHNGAHGTMVGKAVTDFNNHAWNVFLLLSASALEENGCGGKTPVGRSAAPCLFLLKLSTIMAVGDVLRSVKQRHMF